MRGAGLGGRGLGGRGLGLGLGLGLWVGGLGVGALGLGLGLWVGGLGVGALGLGLVGCAAPPIEAAANTVYQGTKDAWAYRAPQPRDVHVPRSPAAVSGAACRTMLAFPSAPPGVFLGSNTVLQLLPWNALAIVWGDDSFAAAVGRAREEAHGSPIFDVRTDLHTTAVLGIWRRECVEVHAAVAR